MTITNFMLPSPSGDIALSQSAGKELPVLMIHGTGASRKVFSQQLSHPLGDRYRLISIDLPGHGDSDDARHPETYTLRGLAATIGRVVDDLGLDRIVVYGWSLGGHVAMEAMSFHPAIAGVMLSGAPPVSKGPIALLRGFHASWDMLLSSRVVFSDRDAERFGRLCFGDQMTEAFLADIKRSDGRCRQRFLNSAMRGDGADQRRTIENANIPVALVNGENERIVRLSYIAGITSPMLWKGAAQVIANAGHSPFWQQPDAFNELFFRFIGDVASTAAATRTVARRSA